MEKLADMKVRIRLTGRSDREMTELFTNILAICIVVFVLTLFLWAAGLDH